ncbi:MAG TPA: N,N-dimethylformamidase beta subunit family domain-containing protein, partial [Verrucomicrobiae bacterium]|nr:N,N-dimethylformamidase beta subunit family domain-containing protein [Verrucomicrobiae bacterium]
TTTIPGDWVSGVYLGKLTTEREQLQSYVIFIVRDVRPADFIFQCSDMTWQAYNRWPDHFALYDNGREHWYCGPGVDVSFNRPYGKYCQILDAPLSTGSGEWFLWEFPLAYWMEAQGYDVTYISNSDTHGDPAGLRRAKGFVSTGHDEYYSLEMYENLRGAIADGLNVAFLSGNTICGRIDPRPSPAGVPNRIYGRTDYFGPRNEGMIKRFPTMARFPYHSPPEGLVLGARSNVPPCTGGADWICTEPDHWIYKGTDMKRGDRIPGLIGWEYHGEPAAIPGLAVVATGQVQDAPGKLNGGVYAATIYHGAKGNFVFNASTCWWGDGLSEPPGYVRPSVYTTPQGPDRRVQRITANLFDRIRAGNIG